MLQAISAFKSYAIEASDGKIGSVSDFLFDGEKWQVRWLVVDTGTWLTERKVLLQPSAIVQIDYEGQKLKTTLTKAQVAGSPDILEHQPVSRQMERELYNYYGWDPLWGGDYLGGSAGAMAAPLAAEPYFGIASAREAADIDPVPPGEDAHLQSIEEVSGYHIEAADGDIGHVENFLVDSAAWAIRYLIVDTSNWWMGQHVLMSPHAVKEIDWSDRHVLLNVTRDQVKASPPWDPLKLMDQTGMKQLHEHYGWPGSGT
jgi:sporulation protein YlmC with PRC-barrel domain